MQVGKYFNNYYTYSAGLAGICYIRACNKFQWLITEHRKLSLICLKRLLALPRTLRHREVAHFRMMAANPSIHTSAYIPVALQNRGISINTLNALLY